MSKLVESYSLRDRRAMCVELQCRKGCEGGKRGTDKGLSGVGGEGRLEGEKSGKVSWERGHQGAIWDIQGTLWFVRLFCVLF